MALAGSARIMHRFTQLTKVWQPTVIQSSSGVFTADPHALLEAEARTLGKFWGARLGPPEAWIPDRTCFPRASVEDLRKKHP
eukprot:3568746-Pyramimonas_sp.AAC.1